MPVPILSSEQLGPRMRPLLMPRKLPSTQPLQPKPTGHAQYRGSRPRRYGHRPTWYAACRPDTHPSQIIAFAMGGDLGGRLRTQGGDVHTDEVYFRDTAHGLLVWAVGVVLTAAFLASAAAAFAGRAAQRTESAQASATEASLFNPNEYLIDTLFRSTGTVTDLNAISMRAEADRIFAHALREGSMSQADNTYLARLISARTGLNEADAQRRVTDVYAQAQEAAEATRKAIAHLSLWLFVALLSGAFCASYAGTIGGRQRDHVPAL